MPACSVGSASWANYIIGDTYAPENEGLSWRDVGSIAEEQGKPPFDALLDLVIADDLRTVLWPKASDGDDASWQARVEVWDNPGAMVGAPMPAPTWTGCADPTIRRRSSVTACASGSSSRWSRPSS